MAALTVALSLAPSWAAARGDEPTPGAAEPPRAESSPHTVKLVLRIAVLQQSGPGYEVEIKPGHPGCKFKPIKRHVDASGVSTVVLNDVRTLSADRDCTFAITIHEPGQAERTIHRGLRLNPDTGPGQVLTCNVNSPSRIARNTRETETTKR